MDNTTHNTSELAKSALEGAIDYVFASEIMAFEWSAENKRYIRIKLNNIIEQTRRNVDKFCTQDYSFKVLDDEIWLVSNDVLDNINDHCALDRLTALKYSYISINYINNQSKEYEQKLLYSDIVCWFISQLLSELRLIGGGNVLTTILDDMTEKLDKENLKNKRDFIF